MSFLRIKYILDKLSSPRASTIDEIRIYLSEFHDINVTNRTLYRDFSKIKYEYGIDIEKRKTPETTLYRLNSDSNRNYSEIITFVNRIAAINMFKIKFGSDGNLPNYITQARGSGSKGSHWLNELISAIHESKMVSFDYQKFQQSEPTKRYVAPYHLKEHNHTWYLIAMSSSNNELRTFGLDRVQNLSVTDSTFIRNQRIDTASLLSKHVGVFLDVHSEPTQILIEVSNSYAVRLNHIPLHHTQQIHQKTESSTIYKYLLIPTVDFYTEVLKMRYHAMIISPVTVRNKMKKIILDMANSYSE